MLALNSILKKYISEYFIVPKGFSKLTPLLLIEFVAISITFYISVFLSKSLGFNQSEVGYCISFMLTGSLLGSLACTHLTRKMNPIKLASIGFFLLGLSFYSLSIVSLFRAALVNMFFLGASSVVMMNANLTSLVQLSKETHLTQKALVMQSVLFNLTVSIMAYLLSVLNLKGHRNLFFTVAIFLILSGVAIYRKSKKIHTTQHRTKRSSPISINKRLLITLIPMVVAYSATFAIVKTFFPVDVLQKYGNGMSAWWILSLNPFMVILTQPILFSFIKNKGNIYTLALGCVLLCFGYLVFGLWNSYMLAILAIFIATVGEMISSPISKSLLSEAFGDGNEGVGISTWKVTYYTSGMIGASIAGYLGNNYGHTYAWSICIPLIAIVMISLMPLFVRNKEYSPVSN